MSVATETLQNDNIVQHVPSPERDAKKSAEAFDKFSADGYELVDVVPMSMSHAGRGAICYFKPASDGIVYEHHVEPLPHATSMPHLLKKKLDELLWRDGWELWRVYVAGMNNRYTVGIFRRQLAEPAESIEPEQIAKGTESVTQEDAEQKPERPGAGGRRRRAG